MEDFGGGVGISVPNREELQCNQLLYIRIKKREKKSKEGVPREETRWIVERSLQLCACTRIAPREFTAKCDASIIHCMRLPFPFKKYEKQKTKLVS